MRVLLVPAPFVEKSVLFPLNRLARLSELESPSSEVYVLRLQPHLCPIGGYVSVPPDHSVLLDSGTCEPVAWFFCKTVLALWGALLLNSRLPSWPRSQDSACQYRACGFDRLGWEDPLEEEMGTHSVFLPGESHRQRSLAGLQSLGSQGV